jgi:hypothetical protein
VRAHMANLDGVAVWITAHRPGQASSASCADDVLDDNLLPERPRHVLTDDASSDICWSSGRSWNNQCNRAARIGLCPRNLRRGGEYSSARCEMQKSTPRNSRDALPIIGEENPFNQP